MKIDQLKSFHQVAVTGSFTRAARELFLTQPAVSQQIQLLEHSLGTTLFDRTGKKATLTGEGEILLLHTERLFEIYNEIEMLFDHLHNLEKGKVTIGSTAVLGTYFLPRLIGRFSKEYPGIDIDMRMGNSRRVTAMLVAGQIDLGFAGKVSSEPRLHGSLIHREKLLLVSSPGNPLTLRGSVTLNEVKKYPFIWREKGTRTRDLVSQWFRQQGGSMNYPDRSIELQSVEAAKRTALEGYGVTIVPQISVMRELHLGLLKPIHLDGLDLTFDYYLFYKKGKIFSKAVEAFIDMLSEFRLLSRAANVRKAFNGKAQSA